jgi:hypothetical protein
MQEFLDINRNSLHEKLSKVKKVKNCYRADEVIEILSNSAVRDKRLINNYTDEEVVVLDVKTKGYTRKARFFTKTGISKYLSEGKVFSYINACKFFEVEPEDLDKKKMKEELKKCIVNSEKLTFNTKATLKWLFEKRKSVKHLGEECSYDELLKWMNTVVVNEKKLELLKEMKKVE